MRECCSCNQLNNLLHLGNIPCQCTSFNIVEVIPTDKHLTFQPNPVCLLLCPTKSHSRRSIAGKRTLETWMRAGEKRVCLLAYRKRSLVLYSRFRWRREKVLMTIGKWPAAMRLPSKSIPWARLGSIKKKQTGSSKRKNQNVFILCRAYFNVDRQW